MKIYNYEDDVDDVSIPSKEKPILLKNGDNYSIMYRTGGSEKKIDFIISKVLTLMDTKVYIDPPDEDMMRLVLDFQRLDVAQQLFEDEKRADWVGKKKTK